MNARMILLATCLSLLSLAPTFAQTPPAKDPPAPPAKPAPQAKIVRLDAWPVLQGDALKTAQTDVERVRKASTEEMAVAGRDGLIKAGAGTAPFLLAALGKEKDETVRDRLVSVLDQVTSAEHTRLLAKEFDSKSRDLRLYVLNRCALFPDKDLRTIAEPLLARVVKDDKVDSDERYATALFATSTGSTAGLPALHLAAVENWNKRGEKIRAALEGVRGPEASTILLAMFKPTDAQGPKDPMLPKEDRQRVVACLNLLAGCGDKSALAKAKSFLDSTDNTVRVAAINAVLGIAEDKPPVANLSAFEAVELAKKLK
jgi:HEAT repeat protein